MIGGNQRTIVNTLMISFLDKFEHSTPHFGGNRRNSVDSFDFPKTDNRGRNLKFHHFIYLSAIQNLSGDDLIG